MQRPGHIKYILLAILLVASELLTAQGIWPVKPLESGETLHLFTDRFFYCSSEKIYFSAFYKGPLDSSEENWSTVLYLELISWDGNKQVQTKVPVEDAVASGFIRIPEHIKSGNYYLRAYTRWMQNYSPYTYTYVPLKILNPKTREIESAPGGSMQESQIQVSENFVTSDKVVFSGLQEKYKRRQWVEFDISLEGGQHSGPFCLGVAKQGVGDDLVEFEPSPEQIKPDSTILLEFLPETEAISISGRVINRLSGESLSHYNVMLASTFDPFYISSTLTDNEGYFLFHILGNTGKHQFCISYVDEGKEDAEILVHNDFCNERVILPFIPFQIYSDEVTLAKEIMISAQLEQKYASEDSDAGNAKNKIPFYGEAGSITSIKDFIDLKDLKEFFFELIPEVYISSDQDMPSLMFTGRSSLSANPPLLLLDNIPVPNNETLLGISTKTLDRIEVINKGYVVGNQMYGGIISIYSNQGDLARFELPGAHQFFDFLLFDKNENSRTGNAEQTKGHEADRHNLLYWDPDLQLTDEGTRIRIYTGGSTGQFAVTIRGAGEMGEKIVYKQDYFEVE